jgi:hypothetical protein
MSWKYANRARQSRARAKLGLPMEYETYAGTDGNMRERLKPIPHRYYKKRNPYPETWRCNRRNVEAIRRCTLALKRTLGLGSIRDVEYKAHTYRFGKRSRTCTRRNDWMNMHKHVKRWWPVVAAAYAHGNHDLL